MPTKPLVVLLILTTFIVSSTVNQTNTLDNRSLLGNIVDSFLFFPEIGHHTDGSNNNYVNECKKKKKKKKGVSLLDKIKFNI